MHILKVQMLTLKPQRCILKLQMHILKFQMHFVCMAMKLPYIAIQESWYLTSDLHLLDYDRKPLLNILHVTMTMSCLSSVMQPWDLKWKGISVPWGSQETQEARE